MLSTITANIKFWILPLWSYIWKSMLAEMNVADVYVRTTGSLLKIIYICRYRNNIQHYMLTNPDYSNISIRNYKQKKIPHIYVN